MQRSAARCAWLPRSPAEMHTHPAWAHCGRWRAMPIRGAALLLRTLQVIGRAQAPLQAPSGVGGNR